MKLSVSLPEEDVEFLDACARLHGYRSRSAVVHAAVRMLRSTKLGDAYAEASGEWVASYEDRAWDTAVADGLGVGWCCAARFVRSISRRHGRAKQTSAGGSTGAEIRRSDPFPGHYGRYGPAREVHRPRTTDTDVARRAAESWPWCLSPPARAAFPL